MMVFETEIYFTFLVMILAKWF